MERNTLMNCKHFSVISALLLFSLMSFAATKPLNSPQGLALDSKGNLYVANNRGSQILIYGSAYAQMTAKTISKGVSSPVVSGRRCARQHLGRDLERWAKCHRNRDRIFIHGCSDRHFHRW